MKVNKVRYVVWSSDMAYVSLLGKHGKSKLEIHLIDVALLKGHRVCRFCLYFAFNNICCLLVVFQNVEISRLKNNVDVTLQLLPFVIENWSAYVPSMRTSV